MSKYIFMFLVTTLLATDTQAETSDTRFQECLSNIKPFVIHYDLSASVIDVTSEHKLQRKNGGWNYRSYADGGILGKAIEESDFYIDNGFKLKEYNSYRRVAFNKKKRYVSIDWEKHSFSTSKNKSGNFKKDITLFDKASQQLAIQCKIKNGEDDFDLNLATRDGIEKYNYKVTSYNDEIKTNMGTFKAIKVQQMRKDSREVYFWLAPKLDHIPIRFIYKEDNGDEVSASIKNFKYL